MTPPAGGVVKDLVVKVGGEADWRSVTPKHTLVRKQEVALGFSSRDLLLITSLHQHV